MSENQILVLGGDMRLCAVADFLKNSGYSVKRALSEKADCGVSSSHISEIGRSDIIVLGIPATHDDLTVNAPMSDETLSLDDFFSKVSSYAIVFGGMISDKFMRRAKERGVRVIDYFDREELQILNAIPTSEGAIEIAMRELAVTLHGSSCLVIGYGRIGKVLCRQLSGLGANVTATSRSFDSLAWIDAAGHIPINTSKVRDLSKYDAVFNTAPHKILTEPLLSTLKASSVVIDLASRPGGVDLDAAKRLNKNVIWALSLPGKCAPITAGKIISDTILNILKQSGEDL